MELEIRVKKNSISAHWFKNVFLVMVAVVTVLLILVCLVVQNRYHSTVSSSAGALVKEFSQLSAAKNEDFFAVSREYVEQFVI